MRVKQSPSKPVQRALNPVMKALTSNELFNHLDTDVKVSVASSICEIMKITAPDSPFGDEQLKEVFKLIVAAFDNISDISSRSYLKRVSILQNFVRIRLWVLLLDLGCGSLILEMFNHFLRNIRESHPEVVFMYMGFIMIMVLGEIEVIPSELLSSLLDSVRNGNKHVLPIARRLSERVIENCASKLELYMHQAVQHTGLPVDNYAKIVAHICDGKSEPVQQNSRYNNTGRHVTCLAPDTMQFGEDLIGSRIRVLCSKEHIAYEGAIVPYDPKKNDMLTMMNVQGNDRDEKILLLENKESEFDYEDPAYMGKLTNVPILDTFCDKHQNKKPKLNSNSLTEEMMGEGTSTKSVSCHPKDGENIFNWKAKTSTDAENMRSESAVESNDGSYQSCCESKQSAADFARPCMKLKIKMRV
ncbi:uncharacterized protein LOC110631345 isoform X2 [Manihot esculenta]|uniref:Uncharacterized protein n=3 Tax=Manihot esculenta TaxID=3983 RepID=A0ACB7GHS7_MANES|nr:uncharacterized protein LOC110631345 isoform X2 [Manihot esculenta]XP_021634831.1 uncharacterized protein LOC110631345 isoform X2 [Manihot esculenta]KAG8639428.1 hypothetical protein MANES_14G112328v8 [Manihot esculenta]KAG8639429.1 hypothetical protein MANES_14G112328v8 [Manihot esculenta]